MGLDGVEIVLEVEETFGLRLPDDSLPRMTTVGDLYTLILAEIDRKREALGEPQCPTAGAFYRLRRAFVEELGCQRPDVRVDTATDSLLSSGDKRTNWRRVGESLGLRLPELKRPRWLVFLLEALFAIYCATVAFRLIRKGIPFGSCLILFLAATLVFWLRALHWTRPLATQLPAQCGTVGQLATQVATLQMGTLATKKGRFPTSEEVWSALQEILVRQLGIRSDQVTLTARFVEDLGLG